MSTFFWTPAVDLIVPTVTTSFLMHRDDSGLCQAHRVGVPEHALINSLKKHLTEQGFSSTVAHIWAYTAYCYLSISKKSLHSRPKREHIFQLCGNLFINEITNVTPTHAGITAADKTHKNKTLYVVSEDGGGSTFIKPTDQKIISEEKVVMTAIDHKQYNGRVKLIKLDIEGYELDALKGAEMTIREFKPVVLFESNAGAEEQRNEIFSFLRKYDYQVGRVEQFDNMFIAVAD